MVRERMLLPEVKRYYGRVKNYIDGEWVDSLSTDVLDVTNPATNGRYSGGPAIHPR